jgi:hypothetical protein
MSPVQTSLTETLPDGTIRHMSIGEYGEKCFQAGKAEATAEANKPIRERQLYRTGYEEGHSAGYAEGIVESEGKSRPSKKASTRKASPSKAQQHEHCPADRRVPRRHTAGGVRTAAGGQAGAVPELLSMMRAKHSARMFYDIYPDNDNVAPNGRVLYYARDRYEKHLEFFAAGADYRERCALFGNRCGKTTAASYELVCHLTGQYPEWWVGKRFEEPILAWAVGKTNESTRDIVQKTLFGSVKYEGHLRALSARA